MNSHQLQQTLNEALGLQVEVHKSAPLMLSMENLQLDPNWSAVQVELLQNAHVLPCG